MTETWVFGAAELVLRSLHGLTEDKKVAFESRLRHLQRLGLTPATRRGKGTRAHYGAGDLLNLALALELIDLGVSPDRVVGALTSKQDEVKTAILRSVDQAYTETVLLN